MGCLKLHDGQRLYRVGTRATFDTNGQNININMPLASEGGPDGGITKIGAGTLTLSGANSYTGTTTVGEGVLELVDSTTDRTGAFAPISARALQNQERQVAVRLCRRL